MPTDRPQRTFILGLDAITPELIEKFVSENRMPNMKRLIEQGTFARPMPVLPTHTPVNWTTIGTGAWPGTHGITGFSVRDKTESLQQVHPAFDTTLVQAEFLWNMAARVGMSSILVKWGGPTYPVTVKKGVQVDGCFCICCDHEIVGPKRFDTSEQPCSTQIALTPTQGWQNIPPSGAEPLETSINIGTDGFPLSLHVLWIASGNDYDTAILCRTRDTNDSIGTIHPSEWTSWITLPFPGEQGERNGTVRIKLLAGSSGHNMALFMSQVMPFSGWTEPESVAEELVKNVGPFLQRVGYNQRGVIYGAWGDEETLMEEMDYQHDWFARAIEYLCANHECQMLFLQSHAPDYIQDAFMRDAEPLTASDPQTGERYMELIARTYESCDRMVGYVIDNVATRDDLVVIVSDHGCIGSLSDRSVVQLMKDLLIKNGFTVYKGQQASEAGSKPRRGHDEIDWTKTRAIVHDSMHIYMNVKGRQPGGVIEPEDYESVRGRIMDVLHRYKDPELGHCPFSAILRSDEAGMVGLYGNRVGDIIVMAREGGDYGEGHGSLSPTAVYGESSLRATLIMSGPGVRKGAVIERPVWLTDVAPTIAHLMSIPPAPTMQGAVLHDMLS